MGRRESREHLFCLLFQRDFHEDEELSEQLGFYMDFLEDRKEEELEAEQPQSISHVIEKYKEEDKQYIEGKLHQIIEKLPLIDPLLDEVSSGWRLNRMGKVDLTLLRLAVYEMNYDEEIPVKVAINEAVELAKKFGADQSPAFVNGVLAKMVKE